MYYFEWDDEKNRSNKEKHGIDFEEASTVFYDETAILLFCHTNNICKKGNSKGGRTIC